MNNLAIKYKLALVALLVAAFFVALYWFGENSQPITPMRQKEAETPQGVAIAADNANVPLSKQQQQEATTIIKTVKEKPPDAIVKATGANVAAETEKQQEKADADFAIVTDPNKPNEQPAIKPDDPVQLNVYNIKAYPRNLVEVSVGFRGADVAYLHRVDVPKVPLILPKGTVGYMGPFIRTEYESGKVDGGLRLVITF